eukprot:509940-Prorocentrum_minimum.AAC.2
MRGGYEGGPSDTFVASPAAACGCSNEAHLFHTQSSISFRAFGIRFVKRGLVRERHLNRAATHTSVSTPVLRRLSRAGWAS